MFHSICRKYESRIEYIKNAADYENELTSYD
jgi:hypothetical protein